MSIKKDGYKVDDLSQGILRKLYQKRKEFQKKKYPGINPFMVTGELSSALDVDRGFKIRYRVNEHLEPAGLVGSIQEVREDGGDGQYRYKITDEAVTWIDHHHPELLIELWEDENISLEDQVQRNHERIAVMSDGEFDGRTIDGVVDRVEELDERLDEIEKQLDELNARQGDASVSEQRVLNIVRSNRDSLPFPTEQEFKQAVHEIASAIAGWIDISASQLGEPGGIVERIVKEMKFDL